MKRCPWCKHPRSYLLADGRRKCARCKRRYSWTSAWNSIRLPERAKRWLLQKFAIGVPAYRLKDHCEASAKSRERFNRTVRAACALDQGISAALCGSELRSRPARQDAAAPHENRRALRGIEFALMVRGGRVAAIPERAGLRRLPRSRIETLLQRGPLEFIGREHARVTLLLRGGRVVCSVRRSPDRSPAINLISEFCHFAMEWLQPYGTVRREYFHLYMGEICFRFNHRREPVEPRILRLLRSQSIQELRPLLVRNGWVTDAPEN